METFENEADLASWLQGFLAPDFYILREVCGRHLIEKTRTRIDFLLMPKPHIVDTGFPQIIFGIEVKYVTEETTRKQITKVYMQAIAYTNSVFNVNKQFAEYMYKNGLQCDPFIRPAFVLVFSNLSFEENLTVRIRDREVYEKMQQATRIYEGSKGRDQFAEKNYEKAVFDIRKAGDDRLNFLGGVMYGISKTAAYQKVGTLQIVKYKSATELDYQMWLFDKFFYTCSCGSGERYHFVEAQLKNLFRTNGGNMDNRKIRRVIGGYQILDVDDFGLYDEENREACGNDIELDEEYYITKYLED